MDSLKAWLAEQLQKVLDWFLELIGWVPKKVFAEVLDEVATVLEQIAPPEFITEAKSLILQLGPALGWFFDLIEFNWGIQLVMSAIAMRYVWSWIPFVGRR